MAMNADGIIMNQRLDRYSIQYRSTGSEVKVMGGLTFTWAWELHNSIPQVSEVKRP